MAGEQIPVTPDLIAWARIRAGYSLEEATKAFKKIEAWEAGEAFPTYPQLEQLANKFKIPIAVFFFPEPPDLPPIEETFRTLPEAQFAEIPSRVKYLLRKAKALQLNLLELTGGRPTAERLITNDLSFQPEVSADDMASQVREYLGISLDVQRSWQSDEVALQQWRQALQSVGIYVFKDAFITRGYSGFSLYDEAFPIIYVNNTSTKTRQIFTLFHELAHLLFHTSGVDSLTDDYIPRLPPDARQIEILCNQFAAAFLIPQDEFEAAIVGREPSEETAGELAATFHVSRESIFRRFLDRGLIDERTYAEAARKWAAQQKQGGGGDYYNNQLADLGTDYVGLVLSHYYQDRISETQAADFLNIAPKNFATLEARFARRG
jgi:Zn-dependent peptidase ImmA (M78 family)